MTSLDHIARDIFWSRQTPAGRAGRRKADHWNTLTPEAREGWRMIARAFVATVKDLPGRTMGAALRLGGKS